MTAGEREILEALSALEGPIRLIAWGVVILALIALFWTVVTVLERTKWIE